MTVHLDLHGHVPSKANRYKIAKRGSKRSLRLDDQAVSEIDYLVLQANQQRPSTAPFIHPEITIRLRVANQRQDRDNVVKTLLDVLQAAGVIKNDNIKHFNGRLVIEPATLVAPDCEGAHIECSTST